MQLTKENGLWKLSGDSYTLTFAIDRPFVYLFDLHGVRLAELFVLSSVHQLHGQDDTVRIGSWTISESSSEIVFSLEAESTIWRRKIYRFRCRPQRFVYEVELDGSGQLADVNYFGGYYSGQIRWGSGFFWSGQVFRKGFNPAPNADEINYFSSAETSCIQLMGVPLPGKSFWFFTPPPFFLGFEGENGWIGAGIEAEPGQNRFTSYSYHGQKDSFFLSLSYEGHTMVNGHYKLPGIGFDFALDEYRILKRHVRALRELEVIPQPGKMDKPGWWYEPIFCGWGAQCYLASLDKAKASDYSRQELYLKFLQTLQENDITPGITVLDDKWQATYGENQIDERKWPDLPGFIRKQHASGGKVLLWLKAWDPEGVPAGECITNAGGLPLAVDPSNPVYESRLRESVRRMLSPQGYDADGFKIDFTARIPSGPGIFIYGDVWGLELMKLYLQIIYDEAKKTKPDALIITHTPHPYLAGVVDMIRLNDLNKGKNVVKAMRHRASVARIACPDALIDTDNWPITDRATWDEYLKIQPELGVPSLYYVSHIDSTNESLDANDYEHIRDVWKRYRSSLEQKRV